MFDQFVISEEARDRIASSSAPWLGSWPALLDALQSHGRLEIHDFDRTWSTVQREATAWLDRDTGMPAAWEDSMEYHDNLMFNAHQALAPKSGRTRAVNWVFDPSVHPGVEGRDQHSHSLSLVLGGHFDDDAHRALVVVAHEALETQLREVNAIIAMSRRLNAAPLAWAPYANYFRAKLANDAANFARDSATEFFEISFPTYRPESVKEFIRLHRDKRVRALREEIVRAHATGDVFDPRYPQRVLEDVIRLQRRAGKKRHVVSWIATLVGLVPEPIVSVSSAVANEIASKVIDVRNERTHRWFYLISDGTGHS